MTNVNRRFVEHRNALTSAEINEAKFAVLDAFRFAMGNSGKPDLSTLSNLPLMLWREFEEREDAGLERLANALAMDVATSYQLFSDYSDWSMEMDEFAFGFLTLLSTRRKMFRTRDGIIDLFYSAEDVHDILSIMAENLESQAAVAC